MIHVAISWLKAGSPANWLLLVACLWVGVSFLLAKIPRLKANTTAELVFNYLNPKVVPVVVYVPVLGPLLALLLKSLDTPAPKQLSLDGAEVVLPRPTNRAAAMLPLLFGIALGGLLVPGCNGMKAPGFATLTTLVNATEQVKQSLPASCEAAQNHAVDTARDEASASSAVAVIQQRCDATLTSCVATRDVAKTARDGIVESTAPDPGWAMAALNGYRNLAVLLKTLGVDAPHVPGVN